VRLDQYIARLQGLTRKQARAVIKRGRVQVAGVVAKDHGRRIAPNVDTVVVDGETLAWEEHLTLMLNKPTGVITATEDRSERTVLDLIDGNAYPRKRDLICVGRLDKDTTGLLLLTTDGALVQRLTHPKHGTEKRYVATVDGVIEPDAATRFAGGMTLRDGTVCRPALLERLEDGRVRVVLGEGKYHQVKRMIAACGGRVTSLHRESVGHLQLGSLAPGECRRLTPAESELLD